MVNVTRLQNMVLGHDYSAIQKVKESLSKSQYDLLHDVAVAREGVISEAVLYNDYGKRTISAILKAGFLRRSVFDSFNFVAHDAVLFMMRMA